MRLGLVPLRARWETLLCLVADEEASADTTGRQAGLATPGPGPKPGPGHGLDANAATPTSMARFAAALLERSGLGRQMDELRRCSLLQLQDSLIGVL